MDIKIEPWQLFTGGGGVGLLTLVGGYFLGGKRKIDSDIRTNQQNADTALLAASSAGFDKAISGTLTAVTNYTQIVEKLAQLQAKVGMLEERLAAAERRLLEKEDELLLSRRKNTALSKLCVKIMTESKEKDRVINSLGVALGAQKDGKESIEGLTSHIQAILQEFTDKYDSSSQKDIVRDRTSAEIQASILEDELDDLVAREMKEE